MFNRKTLKEALHRFTQAEIAEYLGIGKSTVGKYVRGETSINKMSIENAEKLLELANKGRWMAIRKSFGISSIIITGSHGGVYVENEDGEIFIPSGRNSNVTRVAVLPLIKQKNIPYWDRLMIDTNLKLKGKFKIRSYDEEQKAFTMIDLNGEYKVYYYDGLVLFLELSSNIKRRYELTFSRSVIDEYDYDKCRKNQMSILNLAEDDVQYTFDNFQEAYDEFEKCYSDVKKDGTHLIIETYHIVEFAENQDDEMEFVGEVCVTPLPETYS